MPQDKFDLLKELMEDDDSFKLASDFNKPLEVIPTGSFGVDVALGAMGYPRGTIIDIYGPPSGGKSLLCMMAIRECQKAGLVPVLIDAERSYTKSTRWLEINGIDTKRLAIKKPKHGEEAFDFISDIIDKEAADLIVVDSAPALIPQISLTKQFVDNAKVGAQALLMSQALQKLTPKIDDSKVCCIFVNQIRARIQIQHGAQPMMSSDAEEATGGNALKFYSSIRMLVRKIQGSEIKGDNDIPTGHRIRVVVKKNKVGPPLRKAEFSIYYESGIDKFEELADILVQTGGAEQKGAWTMYGDHKFQGIQKFVQHLKNPAEYEKAVKVLKDKTTGYLAPTKSPQIVTKP